MLASDITIQDAGNLISATEVEGALQEIVTKYNLLQADNMSQLATKATHTELQAVASGTPRTTYSTLALLQAGIPLGDIYSYVTSDGHRYWWNGSVWVDGGLYNSMAIGEKSQPISILSVSKAGKNLFDKNRVLADIAMSSSGVITTAVGSSATNYQILVTPSQPYFLHKCTNVCWYDASSVFISRNTFAVDTLLTAPSNALFAKVTILTADLAIAQVEQNTIATVYENFVYIIPKENTEKHPLVSGDFTTGLLAWDTANYLIQGKNLANKDTATLGKYVSQTTGVLYANASYDAFEFIPALANTQYILTPTNVNTRIAYYNINKGFLAGVLNPTFPVTTPTGCAYITFSGDKVWTPIYQLEVGSVATVFEKYGFRSPKLITDSQAINEILLFLPSEICIAVGRTVELYHSQITACGNINNYHFMWACDIGRAMKRKWMYTGITEKIGNHTLTCNIYDNDRLLVASATTVIKVVSAVIAPTNVLAMGDSLSNRKAWFGEVRLLSANAITYIGTRTGLSTDGEHEGRSGVMASWYLADSAYTYDSNFDGSFGVGTVNPFWNPSTSMFDLAYYKATYGKTPNAIQLFLGTNGIALDATANAGSIKTIVDKIREADAVIPLFIVYPLYRGDQDGIGNQLSTDGYSAGSGVWKLEEDRKIFNLMKKLNDLLAGYSNLHFIPVAITHDSEYNFGSTLTPVNARATNTELMEIEGTHPQLQGYLQMADIMYSTFCAYL
ncbi:MAG TPA: hypothetical protein VIM70_04280 [Clostridium sp.]|uniref:hypothetical protein n=1 Tax=Clostridium sp. TaxID=1506 RepID=UPI002F93ADE8